MKSNSPQGNVILQQKIETLEFRKESFSVIYHNWKDLDTDEEFTTTKQDELNLAQVHNQYRNKYGIPFIDEIIHIREQYGLSAAKMSEILGLGPNVYRNYELGEIPSITTGRLIQLAKDPVEFRKLIELTSNELKPHELDNINKKVSEKLAGYDEFEQRMEEQLFGTRVPNLYNGYRSPSFKKLGMMVKFFAISLAPFKTKMNKLLFYADFSHYANTGYSITGLTYVAISHGPVPKNYGAIYDRLWDNGFVDIEEVEYNGYEGEKFLNHDGSPDLGVFTELEVNILERVVKEIGTYSTSRVVDMSHNEMAWKRNVDKFGRINYDFGFTLLKCRE
jgi:uncharacterized phage-associated protein